MKSKIKRIFQKILGENSRLYKKLYSFYYKRKWYWLPKKKPTPDKLIEAYSKYKKGVNFIQIGANDGITNDPIQKYVKQLNWKGILIEPIPSVFEQLKKNYHNTVDLAFENCAISNKNEKRMFYYFDYEEGYHTLSSFSLQTLKNHKIVRDEKKNQIKKAMIPCVTFDFIIDKYNIQKLDFLQIDTEGYDYKILQSIDFNKIRPEVIHFEHSHLKDRMYKECFKFLYHNNYRTYVGFADTFAISSEIEKILLKYISA